VKEDRPHDALETAQRIEPARLENPPEIVADLIAELSATSAKLGSSLHPQTAAHLAELALATSNALWPGSSITTSAAAVCRSKRPLEG
jgi:hypothetical protein